MYDDPLGRAAMEADNLFYYLTYPGCINLESLDDASLKKVSYDMYMYSDRKLKMINNQ